MSHAVLFTEFPLDHLEAATDAVRQVWQIPAIDARAKIQRGWGFLERDIPEPRARQLVEGLAGHATGAVAIANTDLKAPGTPSVMLGFEPDADGFTPRQPSPTAPTLHIRWGDVAVVAAAGFTEDLIRRESTERQKSGAAQIVGIGLFLATGIPTRGLFGGRKKQAKLVTTKRQIMIGQIITTQAAAFGFNLDQFDFSGLGPNKQVNATLNFRTLIAEFARRTNARLNIGARFVLENKSLTMANYHSTRDFETELTWMANTTRAAG